MPPKKPDYADDISDREWALLHRPTTTIPKAERAYLAERLQAYGVGLRWREHVARVDVTFRGGFAYVEAMHPEPPPEVAAEYEGTPYTPHWLTPTKLMRLGWIGKRDDWLFAFFRYSNEKYDPSFLPSGATSGTPEEAFDCAAGPYMGQM